MPDLKPTGAVDVVVRQVRRVRRRKNFYELQRAVYLTIVVTALGATLLLPLALFAPTRIFATAAWAGVAVLLGFTLLFSGAARRRWVASGAAVRWIEERGALAGRLRTLLEIEERPSTRFFLPLLAADVGGNLEAWAPRRLVPRRIPRAAAASAVLAIAVLALALRFAATSVPALPQIIVGNAPRGGEAAEAPGEAGLPDQVLIAPAERGDEDRDGASASERPAAREPSRLASLPGTLQENVRRHVWGEAWERVRDTLARAGDEGGSGTPVMPGDAEYAEPGADEQEDWEIARAPSGALARRRRLGVGRQAPRGDRNATANDEAGAQPERAPADADQEAGGEGGGGAGNGKGPELFGAPNADDGSAAGSFELSLAARMRAFGASDRPPAGRHAPAADPDARPELAADQRRESAAHRMAVPAAYEPVVREVFAHRRAPEQP